MKSTTHRVVILNNVNSEIISQAILILKNPSAVSDSAALAEAEKIVEKYMQNESYVTDEKNGRFMVTFLSLSAIIFAGICIFAIMKMV